MVTSEHAEVLQRVLRDAVIAAVEVLAPSLPGVKSAVALRRGPMQAAILESELNAVKYVEQAAEMFLGIDDVEEVERPVVAAA